MRCIPDRCCLAVIAALTLPSAAWSADIDFTSAFHEAKASPVGGTIVVSADPGDVLVLRQATVILDGLALLIDAERLRLEGSSTIRAFTPDSEPPKKAGVPASVPTPPAQPQAGYSTGGENGHEGYQGNPGEQGDRGRPAKLVALEVDEILGDGSLHVANEGEKGGKGQKGGEGGTGGGGGKGGTAKGGWPSCRGGGGDGGFGGVGGKGGTGGMGGQGGNGGTIVLSCKAATSPERITTSVAGGIGGGGGERGEPGDGGLGGQGGEGGGRCKGGVTRPKANPGPHGDPGRTGPDGPVGQVITLACP